MFSCPASSKRCGHWRSTLGPELVLFTCVALAIGVLLYRDLPVFGILSVVLLARALVDGRYAVNLAGTPATNLLGVGLVALGVAALLRGGRLAVLVVGFAVIAGFSALSARNTVPGVMEEWLRSLSVLGAAAIVANLPRMPRPQSVILLVQLVGGLSATVSLYQVATGTGHLVDGVMRATGTMAHPNSAALVYAIMVTASLGQYFSGGRRRRDLIWALLGGSALLACGSMGGLLAFVVMILAYALISKGIRLRTRVAAVFLAALAASAFALSPLGAARLSELSGLDLSAEAAERNSLEWRVGRWRELLEHWSSQPQFGLGFGSTANGAYLDGYAPHSEYVRILSETGLVGLGVFAVSAVLLIRALKRAAEDGSERAGIARVALAVAIGLAVNALAENTFMYAVPMYLFALLASYGLARRRSWVSKADDVTMASLESVSDRPPGSTHTRKQTSSFRRATPMSKAAAKRGPVE